MVFGNMASFISSIELPWLLMIDSQHESSLMNKAKKNKANYRMIKNMVLRWFFENNPTEHQLCSHYNTMLFYNKSGKI
jgi:hypothetical protein